MVKKLVMFEDDPHYAQLLRTAYETVGFSVTWYSSPPADPVIAIARDMPYVISLDLMMPVLDGFQVAELLQKDRQTAVIPCVFVTSIDRPENRERAHKLTARHYFVKSQHTVDEIAHKVWSEVVPPIR